MFSRLCQVAQILKKGILCWRWSVANPFEFEQGSMVEFIPLPFLFWSKLRIWPFHVVRSSTGTKKKFTRKLAWDQAQQLGGGERPKNKNRKKDLSARFARRFFFFFFCPMRSLVPGYKKAWKKKALLFYSLKLSRLFWRCRCHGCHGSSSWM